MRYMENMDFTNTRMELNENEFRKLAEFAAWAEDAKKVPSLAEVEQVLIDMPFMIGYRFREAYIAQFGFALPCKELLTAIKKLKLPIISVGCGTGYLEKILSSAGIDVIATDLHPPRHGTNTYSLSHGAGWGEFLEIKRMGAVTAVKKYPERAVFCCWPSYEGIWAHNAAKAMMPGQVLIYIGEWHGCTAEARFHRELDEEFEDLARIQIPQFDGLHDVAYIFRKKEIAP